uniref:Regulatory protein zeste n=1 Tax=Cacopsylla melanoneura TaxID=428564 RepID=A0A8D9FEQ3_9HEMI
MGRILVLEEEEEGVKIFIEISIVPIVKFLNYKNKMEEEVKRVNFSDEEKKFLETLIMTKYGKIVDSKKTDDGTKAEKKQAWENLAQEFNAQNLLRKRAPTQLKKYWENIKTRRKKLLTQDKNQRLITGGGPEPTGTWSPEPELDSYIQTQVDTELKFPHDSDHYFLTRNKEPVSVVSIVSENEDILVEEYEDPDFNVDNVAMSSTLIERPRPETTSRSKKRHCSSFLGTRASAIEEEKTKRLQKVVKSTQYEEDLHKEQLKYEAKRMELVVIQIANAKEKKH